MSPLRDKLSEFFKCVNNSASNESFGNEFCKLSFKGNRRGMIEKLIELPEMKNMEIEKFYNAKDDNLACSLYERLLTLKNLETGKRIKILINALFKSSYASMTFFQILMELTKTYYKSGDIVKCLKNCEYFQKQENSADEQIFKQFQIEFLLIESECYKQLGLNEKSKFHLNEAMKRVNEFINEKCGTEEESFKNEKHLFLKPILERLKAMKLCPTSKNSNHSLPKDKKIPKVEGELSEKLKSCSDAISLGYNEAKGRFLFANRRIKTGSVLIVDRPFAFSTDASALERNCLHCHTSLNLIENIRVPCRNCQTVSYCSEHCRQESWTNYHKYECEIFHYFSNLEENCQQSSSRFLLAYRTTLGKILTNSSSLLNGEFFDYHSTKIGDNEFETNSKSKIYDSLDYETVYQLETHCSQVDPKENFHLALTCIFLAKLFEFVLKNEREISLKQSEIILIAVGNFRHLQAIGCNAYEIVENVRNQRTKAIEPRNVGGAIYTTVSLTNHSCYPNVIRHSYPHGTVVVTALRPIEKGMEIFDCYGPHFLKDTRNKRQDQLLKKFYFHCQCEACTFDWKLPLSDKLELKCTLNAKKGENPEKYSKRGDGRKIRQQYEESKKKKQSAIAKMYNDNYTEALPILLEHSNFIENIFSEPNLDIIQTQQSIIQCLNSMSCNAN